MESYKFTRLLWGILALLLAFGQALPTREPERPPPKDSLEVRVDYPLYEQGPIFFSSHLKFDVAPQISDKQFKSLAVDAFREMEYLYGKKEYDWGSAKKPNVMTTLIAGNEIFFASSVKKGELLELDAATKEDLDACADDKKNGQAQHKNKGRCGEVMALETYYRSNVNAAKLGRDARIVAITKSGDVYKILDPCGEEPKWGCNRLVQGFSVLTDDKVNSDPTEDPFNWRQLRDEKRLTITQTHAKASDVKAAVQESKGKKSSSSQNSSNQPGTSGTPAKQTSKAPEGAVPEEPPAEGQDLEADGLPPVNAERLNRLRQKGQSNPGAEGQDLEADGLPPVNTIRLNKLKKNRKPTPSGEGPANGGDDAATHGKGKPTSKPKHKGQ